MNTFSALRIKFVERFKRRHSLRLHMSLILMATLCSGFLATRLLLAGHLENVLVRYPLAVVFAYLVFFLSIKVWLKAITPAPVVSKARGASADVLDVVADLPGSGAGEAIGEVFRGAGGGFGGGGASGGFDEAGAALMAGGKEVLSGAVDSGGGIGDAVGDIAGDAVSAVGDEGGGLVVVVLAILALLLFALIGVGAYLVYEAPFILSEAAFQFILAAGLVRGAKRINAADWFGSVFKTTAIPFAVTFGLAVLVGFLMHRYFPGVTRISELFSHLK